MATDKPRFTITLPDDVYDQVAQYKTENKISTQSKAIQKLIGIGLDSVETPAREQQAPSVGGLDAEDVEVARDFHALDQPGKKVVRLVIGAEAERVESPKAAVEETPQEPPRVKIVPLFPAAAGPGEPVDGSVFDNYELPADSPADFAVKISGDSMAPEFQDGEIVLCVKRYPEIGEIAAVMVNGFLVVKQFISDGANIYLRSLNRQRKNLDVDIWASGSDSVKCYGTVIHKKIPLVME